MDKDNDGDHDLVIPTRPSDESKESMGKVCPRKKEASSASNGDGRPTGKGSMIIKMMDELVLRYGVSPVMFVGPHHQ